MGSHDWKPCMSSRSASSITSQRRCCSVKPPPARTCSTRRPGVATSTSTAERPLANARPTPPPEATPDATGAVDRPRSACRSSSHDAPSIPTASPALSGSCSHSDASTPNT
eukprot:scaffold10356_cov118-Isochrysis_galbana.AAC.10